ncbi:MAG: hypothetical protein HZC02_02750 [Candidatus Levybacteria bacterium]|nr:hypothetical protein [Candidatus Levybacteria bacterium]
MSWLKIIGISLLFTLILTFPSILHVGSSFIGDGWDNYQQAGYQAFVGKSLREGQNPLVHTNFWRYPIGFDFSRAFDSYLAIGLGGILSTVLPMPFSYNLVIYLLLLLNGVTSYYFFRKISDNTTLGIIGAIMYGFSFYVLSKAGSHANLIFIGAVPLIGLSILRIRSDMPTSKKSLTLYAITIAAILLGAMQYIIMIGIQLIWIAILYLLLYRSDIAMLKEKFSKHFTTWLTLIVCSLTAFLLLFNAQLSALLSGNFIFFARAEVLKHATPSITDFFLPNSYLTSFLLLPFPHSLSDSSIEKVVFFGYIELVLMLLFFVTSHARKLKLFLGLAFLFPFLLSLGYGDYNHFFLLPYRFLSHIFPFTGIAEAGRFAVISLFIMSIAGVLFLQKLRFNNKKILLLLIITTLMLERATVAFPLSPSLHDKYTTIVKGLDGNAVLDIPINPYYGRYNMLSIYYDKPIVNGYIHWSADGTREQSFLFHDSYLSLFSCSENDPVLTSKTEQEFQTVINQQLHTLLRDNNIKTVVVHKDDKFYHTICTNVRQRLATFFEQTYSLSSTKNTGQQQLQDTILEAKPKVSLYFPSKGVFYLDGAYFAPSQQADFSISLNNSPLEEKYEFVPGPDAYSRELIPKQTIKIAVEAGSEITIFSKTLVRQTAYSVWYRYEPEGNEIIPLKEPFEKVYDDEKATIYSIN